jgi:Zn-finger nucleic acid-binding protein
MKCPNCGDALAAAKRDGIDVEACPTCKGLWLTRAEFGQLEDEAYDLGKKGSLVFHPEPSERQCPVCASVLQRFRYRDYELELEFCPQGHGFWLDAGEDQRVLRLMKVEERSLKRKFSAEDEWASHLRHWRTPNVIDRLINLLR